MKNPTKRLTWLLILIDIKSLQLLEQATKIKKCPGFSSYYLDIIPGHTVYASHHYCQDCEEDMPEGHMVRNDVWKSAGMSKTGHLCFFCLEKRLERKLTIEDFTDAPINKLIHFGHQ